MVKKVKKVGRPRKNPEKVQKISVTVNVTENEYSTIQAVATNLGYNTIAPLLRSAITKGIIVSARGEMTFPKDVKHWEYWRDNWDAMEHFEDNPELKPKKLLLK
jgi:hypothetical protein